MMIKIFFILLVTGLAAVGDEILLDTRVSSFGQTLTLLCRFNTICKKIVGWEVWNPHSSTLDVRNFTIYPTAKYSSVDGYTLNIRNLSKDDLNKSYTCNCLFTRSEKIFLTEQVVFISDNSSIPFETTTIGHHDSKVLVAICTIFGIVFLVAILFIIYRRKMQRPVCCCVSTKGFKVVNNSGEAENILNEIYAGEKITIEYKSKKQKKDIKWLKDGVSLKDTEKHKLINDANGTHHKLEIFNTVEDDSGYYSVSTRKIEKKVELKVKNLFSMPLTCNKNRIREWETFKLSCEVVDSSIEAKWKKDGEVLKNTDRLQIEVDGMKHTLKIFKAKLADSGEYSIWCNNISSTTKVNVIELAEISDEEDYFLTRRRELEKLQERYLAQRALGFLPSAIQQMGDEKIEEYKRILKAGKEKRYYVKMFFLGKNGVGKTSLMRRLLKEEITNVESTHGLDIVRSCKISVPDGEWIFNMGKKETPEKLYADCIMVDFAGEKDYYITHQTFLTVNAVFLLTVSLLDDNIFADNIPDEDKISFWLDNIHCYATKREIYIEQAAIQENQIPETHKENKLDPPVIVVCTNATEEDPSVTENRKFDLKDKKRTFFTKLCKIGKLNNRRDHFCGNIQYLSNKSDKDDNFQELRNLIYRSASTLPDWGKEVPTRWIELEKELNKERNEQKRILEIGRIKEIAIVISSDFTDNEIIFFLNYQHLSGNLIFFEDMKDLIILDPKWLIDVFKCLVCAEKFQSKIEHGCIWKNVEETGEIKETEILQLLASIPETFDRSFILGVMEKFDITVKEIQKETNKSVYVIPSMIKRKKPEPFEYKKRYSKGKSSSWLCLTFDFLPPVLFNHIIVCFMRDAKFDREELYHGMCVFNRHDTNKMEKLIICKFSNTITFQYVLLDEKDLFSSWTVSENAKFVLENVNTAVQYCTSGARYGMAINYSKQVMCNFQFDSIEHAVEIEKLKSRKMFSCRHEGDVKTHDSSDEIYSFWTKNVEMFEVTASGEATIQNIERSMKRFKDHIRSYTNDEVTRYIGRLRECLKEEKRRADVLQFTDNINDIVTTTADLKIVADQIFLTAYSKKLSYAVENAKELVQAREIRMLRALLDSDQRQTLDRQVEKLTKLTDQCKTVPPETIEQATEELREMINKSFKEANKEKLQFTVQDVDKLKKNSRYLRHILDSDQDHPLKKQIAKIDDLIDNCKDVAPETIEQAVEELQKLEGNH